MGIFGQNTGKTITKREQCTSKGAIYRGNPHFRPFSTTAHDLHRFTSYAPYSHLRTRSRTAIPSPHNYHRTISTAIHHRTRTVLRTPHRCTHDISAQLPDLHVSIYETTLWPMWTTRIPSGHQPHLRGGVPFVLRRVSRNLTCANSLIQRCPRNHRW